MLNRDHKLSSAINTSTVDRSLCAITDLLQIGWSENKSIILGLTSRLANASHASDSAWSPS
jgi:hypothetical protein